MTQDKHTALPWKVYYAKNNDQLVLGLGEMDGQAITNHSGAFWRDEDEARANAEFVCLAVNNHYQLVEALEYARRFLKPEDVDMAYIDQALSNAKGGSDE